MNVHGQRDGQSDGESDGPPPYPVQEYDADWVNRAHRFSDVDTSQLSQHHRIGIGHNQAASGDHIHNGTNSKTINYKDIPGLFALLPQRLAITGITDASGFLVFNHGFKDINGANAAPSMIITQVHDSGTPTFGNVDIIDGSITTTQAKGYCVLFNGSARVSATVNFWIACYA